MFKELQSMALKFDTDKNGNIKPTIKNLKLKNIIALKVRKILQDPSYQRAVKDFTKEFGKLATIQDSWAKTIDKNAN